MFTVSENLWDWFQMNLTLDNPPQLNMSTMLQLFSSGSLCVIANLRKNINSNFSNYLRWVKKCIWFISDAKNNQQFSHSHKGL